MMRAEKQNSWIDAADYKPKIGKLVEVRGDYVPAGTGFPKAYWNGKEWVSTEWRGTVAIRQWRNI